MRSDAYGMLIVKVCMHASPETMVGAQSLCIERGSRGIWAGTWIYVFGTHQAPSYASIKPLGYRLRLDLS